MFARLPETGAKRERSVWGTAASVGVHAGIVLLAIFGTAKAGSPPRIFVEKPTTIVLHRDDDDATRTTKRHAKGGRTSDDIGASLPVPPVDRGLFTVADPVDVDANLGVRLDTALLGEIGHGGGQEGGRAGDAGDGSGIANEWAVDERVGVVSDRAPRYPEALRAMGVTGTVVVRFVVDTAGRADMRAVQVVDSPHEQFTAAVLATLRQTRFVPGRLHGRPVATLVQRSFRFDIEGRR